MELILTIDTIPSRTWRVNVRHSMPRASWEKIREQTFRIHGRRCSICGYDGRKIEVHEAWEFDYERGIQRLTGFIPLCKLCHLVKHWGMARVLRSKGQLDMNTLVKHFMRVNGCSYEEFVDHVGEAHFTSLGKALSSWRIEIKGQARERPRGSEQLWFSWGRSPKRGRCRR